MKHAGRINNLNVVLRTLDLGGVPVLIIDDEADQAGLNTAARQLNRTSATNRSILALRQVTLSHLYLEYTATPQALLLLQLVDSLSPEFAEVLEAGPDYVGLGEFFQDRNQLVQIIPLNELPTAANALTGPPASFLRALALYFIGVTVGGERDDAIGNRSMLVHPSRLRDDHGDYHEWAQRVSRDWLQILRGADEHADRRDLWQLFRAAYEDLQSTDDELPTFEQIMARIPFWISRTEIIEVNTRGGRTPSIDWDRSYAYILVGGQAMDRGFTVRGLTVTYMPRSVGVGNADVIQQRARFLGYKRPILSLCRVFIDADVAKAYRDYERHEASVRDALQLEGGNLKQWRRRFLLDPSWEPTRRSVYVDPLVRGVAREDWTAPRYAHLSAVATDENRALVDHFMATHAFSSQIMGHRAELNVRLNDVLAQLLVDYRLVDPGDAQRFQALLLSLREALDSNESIVCDVMEMVTQDDGTPRERSVTSSGAINQLYQGRRPKTGVPVYAGDRAAYRQGMVTVQIHRIDIKSGGRVEHANVPYIAVFLPAGVALASRDVVEQPDNV